MRAIRADRKAQPSHPQGDWRPGVRAAYSTTVAVRARNPWPARVMNTEAEDGGPNDLADLVQIIHRTQRPLLRLWLLNEPHHALQRRPRDEQPLHDGVVQISLTGRAPTR